MVKADESIRHSNVDPIWVAWNVNVAVMSCVTLDGPESMIVSGGIVSTIHVRAAGDGSTFPARSVARTLKVCEPWPRPVKLCVVDESHELNPAPSSEHVRVEPGSVAWKVKLAAV